MAFERILKEGDQVTYPGSYIMLAVSAIVLIVAVARLLLVPGDRRRGTWFLLACLWTIALEIGLPWFFYYSAAFRPLKYDQYIYRLDGLLGFQPSFVLGRLFARVLLLDILCRLAYVFLPWTYLAVFSLYIWRRSADLGLMLRCALWNLTGILCYLLVPVSGPVYAFAHFPAVAPAIAHPAIIALNSPPNGIPSLHMSTALLILYFLRRWGYGRLFGGVYLGFTILATLGTGQHYLFDLLTALPFTAAVVFLAKRVRLPRPIDCAAMVPAELA